MFIRWEADSSAFFPRLRIEHWELNIDQISYNKLNNYSVSVAAVLAAYDNDLLCRAQGQIEIHGGICIRVDHDVLSRFVGIFVFVGI